MKNPNQIGTAPTSSGRGRGGLLWLGASLASLLGLIEVLTVGWALGWFVTRAAGHGVLMFPVLKPQSERMVIGYLAFRIIDTDSISCLRIGSTINKEPILLLEIPNKLRNSDNSGTLRPSD